VPRDQRIQDAVTWHKALSRLMIDAHYGATTFNVAFFMHNLFRDEIERENQEIQAEKKLELPKKAEPAPVPASANETREVTAVRETTLSGTRSQFVEEKSKKGLWIGLAAAVLVAVGVGGYLMMSGGKTETASQPPGPQPAAPLAQPATLPGGAQPTPVQASGPTPEELQAQIQAMIAAQSKDVEAKLKDQYDQRLKQLQQQLEDSKRAAAEPLPVRQTPTVAVETPAPPPVETKPAPRQETPAPTPEPTPEQPRVASNPEPTPQQAPVIPAPAPVRKAQLGDLVQAGPGVTSPRLTSRLDPRYPETAARINKAAQVDIRVLVDETGRVVDAQRSGPKVGFGFDESALEAARRASFSPAIKDGVRVKMWSTIRVSFQARRK